MSDRNKTVNTNQTKPTNYELSRAHARQGAHNSAVKAIGQNPPANKGEAAVFAAKTGAAGAKEYGKSAYHAGMGFMEGVSKQNPNSGQQLNNMKINQAIANGKQPTVNKGIEAARQKAAAKPTETCKSTNKGIASFQSKTSGQSSSGSSKGSSSGQSSGSQSTGSQSSGSSKGNSR